jgi:hypothetical protein
MKMKSLPFDSSCDVLYYSRRADSNEYLYAAVESKRKVGYSPYYGSAHDIFAVKRGVVIEEPDQLAVFRCLT